MLHKDRSRICNSDDAGGGQEYDPIVEILVDGYALLLYCDGACRGNGTPHARGTAAVYFSLDYL